MDDLQTMTALGATPLTTIRCIPICGWRSKAFGRWVLCGIVAGVVWIGGARCAQAIPSFARKYQTSCQTCHTVYPKLSPFGEAFRRNGYRFPGSDSDIAKQETVALGQQAAVANFPDTAWPGTLPASPPLALAFNGEALVHPDRHSGGARRDDGRWLNLQGLINEAQLLAGGSFDEHLTFFAELTADKSGVVIEQARAIFSDVIGPPHAINLWVGKGPATLSSFGPHSSYVSDTLITPLLLTALEGGTGSTWSVTDSFNAIEMNGVVAGQVLYALGVSAGSSPDVAMNTGYYGHVGYKIGGLTLDGEGGGLNDAAHPWAETALTLDVFACNASSRFTNRLMLSQADDISTWGGNIRAEWRGLELTTGMYQEHHQHAQVGAGAVRGRAYFSEASYVFYPWLVVAARFEYVLLTPTARATVSDARLLPAVVVLLRPNLKLKLEGQWEAAQGSPAAGWAAAGGFAYVGRRARVGPEMEALRLGLGFAF